MTTTEPLDLDSVRSLIERYQRTRSPVVGLVVAERAPALVAEVERLTEQAAQWMNQARHQATERDKNYAEVQRLRAELASLAELRDAAVAWRDAEHDHHATLSVEEVALAQAVRKHRLETGRW